MKTTIKKPPPAFIKTDEIIQRVLGILILLTLIIYPVALLLLMPFGAWQVISGIVGALYGSKWRMKYLGFVILYFSSLGVLAYIGDDYIPSDFVLNPVFTFIYGISPPILGIVYYVKTRKERSKEEGIRPQWKDMDDVLDIDMMD